MPIDLTRRTALVTGAGRGLGREHAFALAKRGARVAVNDLDKTASDAVVDELSAMGFEAIGVAGSVTDPDAVTAMVEDVVARFGSVDIMVCNAGVLRDRSFAKMSVSDFRLVLEVHLMGAFHCAQAVWPLMRDNGWGRIVLTTSSSGLFGNFGQANYGAAKMALVGLMQTLAIEGSKHGIRVNCLAPTASTGMTEGLLPIDDLARLDPALVSPALIALVGDDAPTRAILCTGAGHVAQARIALTEGIWIGDRHDAADQIAANMEKIGDLTGAVIPTSGAEQPLRELASARLHPEAIAHKTVCPT